MENKHPPELSVVLLFYRAEDLARDIFIQITRELSDAGIDYELILVGNYFSKATDKTPEVVEELAKKDPRSIVVRARPHGSIRRLAQMIIVRTDHDHLV